LGSLDELSDLFDVKVISFDGANDLFDLFGFGMGEVLGYGKLLEDSCRGDGEGVFDGAGIFYVL
jgi:hypothetical protein